MKIGIIGRPGAGKSTVFEALTRVFEEPTHRGEARVGTVPVPDGRVDWLSGQYEPKKTTYAQVEYFLPGLPGGQRESLQKALNQVRDADALLHVLRNFNGLELDSPRPWEDFSVIEQEIILADQVVIEKRLERITADHKRGKKADPEEQALLSEGLKLLESETPLRRRSELAQAPLLKGFRFLSAKPQLILFNNADDDDRLPEANGLTQAEEGLVIRGKLERELARMSDEEAAEFQTEYGITASARDRVLRRSYALLGLISFFTVGDDEVRAWTLRKGEPALRAAGVVHTDMEKGFIRAEVVALEDLRSAGSMAEARKRGLIRLESKTYFVQDGDVINFRFSV
ncbi:MAG: DUF933 domain-containing protein [Thermodesulfobacteriota bacterium]